MQEILRYFPNNISRILERYVIQENEIREIRIRSNKPIILKLRNDDIILDYIIEPSEIMQILEKMCENSIYAYKRQMCEGFLTIRGGHRVGIVGTAVIENNEVINMNYITSLNVRIAREIVGCSDSIIPQIIDTENQTVFNTLIVSPPGKGKTTMLRDIIRNISDRNRRN